MIVNYLQKIRHVALILNFLKKQLFTIHYYSIELIFDIMQGVKYKYSVDALKVGYELKSEAYNKLTNKPLDNPSFVLYTQTIKIFIQ